jgi:hypothetical protein
MVAGLVKNVGTSTILFDLNATLKVVELRDQLLPSLK